jgi:rifampicin phosphotransferase
MKSEPRTPSPEPRTATCEQRPARRSPGEGGPFVLPLHSALDERQVGGKARNLAQLIGLGQPVPDGFVITNAALQCVLGRHGGDGDIQRASLPSELIADLDFLYTVCLWDTVVVRSSAVGEDSACASFAGQLDSMLNVRGAAALRQAVLDVWASLSSPRVRSYQQARGLTLDGMGVIVQRQISSAVSGVLFTTSPGNSDEMLVEYCRGLGDALVSGRENPGRLAIDRQTMKWTAQAQPDGEPATLTDVQIATLARRALEIERAFGAPQDIEWTFDVEGALWIVQSRPITTHAAPGARVVWSNANVNENFPAPISPLLYSIARTGYYHYFRNLGRAFGFSSRRIAAMEDPLRHIIGVHGARMYYNLTSIHGILRSAPFGELLAGWFNRFVGAEDTETRAFVPMRDEVRPQPDPTVDSPDPSLLKQIAELTRIAACTTWQYLFVTRRVVRFERTADAFAERTQPDRLRSRPRHELLNDLRGFVDIRNNRWTDASLADTAAMVCYGALQRVLARQFPSADRAALHNSLLKALPNLPSGMPALRLWDLSRMVRADLRLLDLLDQRSNADALCAIGHDPAFQAFRTELERFEDDWGFRCSGELMLTTPSFQDEPERLLDILKVYVGMEGSSPAEHLATQAAEREQETARIAAELRRRPLIPYVPLLNHWHALSILLRWTQNSIVLRERVRLKQALLYSRLRRIALALGDRLVRSGHFAKPDDIFFLTVDEIDDFVTGSAMFPNAITRLIALRRQAHLELSAATPPDSLRLIRGEYWSAADATTIAKTDGTLNANLVGLGVCGGQTTARAAVLTDVSEAHLLKPGDVLVTRQTDPGWGVVFPLISGLIMERGGMLSHGAIIAREFGIPSVVGISDATRLIPHGSRVHLDGDLGLVRKEEAA